MSMWRGASRSWRPWLYSLCPDLCHGTDWQVVFLSVPCCLLCTFVVAFMAMNAFACSLCLFRSAWPGPAAQPPRERSHPRGRHLQRPRANARPMWCIPPLPNNSRGGARPAGSGTEAWARATERFKSCVRVRVHEFLGQNFLGGKFCNLDPKSRCHIWGVKDLVLPGSGAIDWHCCVSRFDGV